MCFRNQSVIGRTTKFIGTLASLLPLPFIRIIRYTAEYEYNEPTEREVCTNSRLPRRLRQQRPDSGECLGFLSGLWDDAAELRDTSGVEKLSGNLSQPAAGEGPDGAAAADCVELRGGFRRD